MSVLTVTQNLHSRVPIFVAVIFAIVEPPFVLGFLGMTGILYQSDPTSSPWVGRRTGRLAPPPPTPVWPPPAPNVGWRWGGGINAPHWLGWFHSPVANIEVDSQRLAIRVPLGWLFLLRPLELTTADHPSCFPVKARIGRRGVAIQPAGGRPWYFWTPAASQILSSLQWAGFEVSWDERRPRFF